MSMISSTPQHCPGFQQLRNLTSFMCQCNHCGEPREIFSDEFDRPHMCTGCGQQIDFSQCELEGQAGTSEPA
jgi:hypothetical protein